MDYLGKKVLVMGLGLHGGGLQSALFLLKRGAEITVTDLRDEKTLMPTIEQLDATCSELGYKPVRYVLEKHEIDDFKKADMVIKNPGVRPDSPFLQVSRHIETDISLFLSESPARLFAVTGTKGKSGTASALHWILKSNRKCGQAYLGGNITVSPLTFLHQLTPNDDVVLELSSFQLGDIKNHKTADGGMLLKPAVSILTSIMEDHLDRYPSMDIYIDDKRNIYRGQETNDITVAGDDDWGKSFHAESKARPLVWTHKQGVQFPLTKDQSGGWIGPCGCGFARLCNRENEIVELVPNKLLTPGAHQKQNLLCAALAAYGAGVNAQTIHSALTNYPGITHRLEFFHETNGVRFYNDSAATVPQAAAACIDALAPIVLVTGGTDKNLDFSPLAAAAKKAKAVILLAGSGSEKLAGLLGEKNIPYSGPFDNLDDAVRCALEKCENGDNAALSPGCASFGMFLNEFDRGNKWKDAVLRLSGDISWT
jgi:UDP-N-acetylmuramoylalanine--D-glutamate ligase